MKKKKLFSIVLVEGYSVRAPSRVSKAFIYKLTKLQADNLHGASVQLKNIDKIRLLRRKLDSPSSK